MSKKNKIISPSDYQTLFTCLMITCANDLNFVSQFFNVVDLVCDPFLADHIKNVYTELNLNIIESEIYKKI